MPQLFPPDYPDCPEAPLLAFGPSFSEEISRSVIAAVSVENLEQPHEVEVRVAASLTMLEAFHPRDQLECMMAAQAVSLHAAMLDSLARGMRPNLSDAMVIKFRANAVQLARGFSLTLRDLERRQTKPLPDRPGTPPRPAPEKAPIRPPRSPRPSKGGSHPSASEAPAVDTPGADARTPDHQTSDAGAAVASPADRQTPNAGDAADCPADRQTPDARDADPSLADRQAPKAWAGDASPANGPATNASAADAMGQDGPVPNAMAADASPADAMVPDGPTSDAPHADAPHANSTSDNPDFPDDIDFRPDGTPGSLAAYAPRPAKDVFVPLEPAIMVALATREKPWRMVNKPPGPAAPPTIAAAETQTRPAFAENATPAIGPNPRTAEPEPMPEPPTQRRDLNDRMLTGDALARFASTRFDPDAPVPVLDFDDEDAVVEIEVISTGGDPEAEAERAALIAAHPEGKPIATFRLGHEKPPDEAPDDG